MNGAPDVPAQLSSLGALASFDTFDGVDHFDFTEERASGTSHLQFQRGGAEVRDTAEVIRGKELT
ncbi:MAG: hypothetical protein IT425_13920 [Pirellulales bacterium]|nr:hypothetical protein [Pirellulales bacterium]